MKDWKGNQNSIYTTLGASNHSEGERQEHAYYATEPKATEILLQHETFNPVIWECACGEGHISKVLEATGQDGCKVAMFLKLQFLEGKARKEMFSKYPPETVYVFSSRVLCAKNGEFEKYPSSAVAYAWFVWKKGFHGFPVIKWVN